VNKLLKLIVLATSLTVGLEGCKDAPSHPDDTLRVDIGAEAPTLDPAKSEDVSSMRVLSDLFAGLVDYDQHNQPIPGLASHWDISHDGLTYIFYLRPNLKFSNGSPISTNDVIYSWQRLVDPATGATYAGLLANVVNGQAIIDGKLSATKLAVTALSPQKLMVKLAHPDPAFLNKLTLVNLAIVPMQVVKQYKQLWTDPKYMVTSGAYQLTQHVVNGYIAATKNRYYFAESQVAIAQINYYPFVDSNAAVAAYKTGDLDATFQALPTSLLTELKSEFAGQFKSVNQEAIAYYEFNMQDPQLSNNLKLRQALSMAIDRNVLTQDVLQDGKRPLYSAVTATIENGKFKDLSYAWESWPQSQRLAVAKQLYAEAGYGPGHQYQTTITYNTNPMYQKISASLAAMWQENLGAEVKLTNQDWKTFIQSRHKGDYQIARSGWFADYNNISTYTPLFACHGPLNDFQWCDPEYDNLIAKATNTNDASTRINYYKAALTRVQNAYIMIPLFQFTFNRMVKPYVGNYNIEQNHFDHVQSKWFYFTDKQN
jgi:oligopeptide transport system substrate-binding protein